MKKIQIVFTRFASPVIFAMLFFGCHNSNINFQNNMDNAAVWTDHPASNLIVSNNAHSGRYVCRLDSLNPFSPTFYKQLNQISNKKLKAVVVSGWFWLNNYNSSPNIILDIRDKNENSIEMISKPAKEAASGTESWFNFSTTIELSQNNRNNPENYLRIYAINPHGSVLLDDLKISFIE